MVLINGQLTFVDAGLPRQDFLVFVVIVPLESLWLLIVGVLMWRRAGRIGAATEAPAVVPQRV